MLTFIKFYQYCISPFLQANCRFRPTCSTYAYQSFKTYGFIKGLWFTLKRLSKCHPFGGYGYDPLPHIKNKKENITNV